MSGLPAVNAEGNLKNAVNMILVGCEISLFSQLCYLFTQPFFFATFFPPIFIITNIKL